MSADPSVLFISLGIVAVLGATPVAGARQAAAASTQSPLEESASLTATIPGLVTAQKLDEALRAATRALELRERAVGSEHPLVAESLNWIGRVHFARGDAAAAEQVFARALAIRRKAAPGEDPQLPTALVNLASAYQARGGLREAEPLLIEAVAVLERTSATPARLGTAHNNLGGLYLVRGDNARARQEFERAAELWQQAYPPAHPNLTSLYNNLGRVAQNLSDFPKAEDYYGRALSNSERAGDSPQLAGLLNNMGSLLQEQGRLDEAAPLYLRAIAIHEKREGPPGADLGQVLNNLAVLYLLKKDYARAGPLYRRALEIREGALGATHPEVATSLAAYAIFLHNTGQRNAAIDAQARATAIIEHNLGLVLEVGSESQKQSYFQLFTDSVDITLWMRQAGGAPTTEGDRTALLTVLRRKGRLQEVLAASSDALRESLPDEARQQLDELTRARAAMSQIALQEPDSAARSARLTALQTSIDTLESALSARAAGLKGRSADVTIEMVQAAIPRNAVLVEFLRYRPFNTNALKLDDRFGASRYVACALRATGAPVWVELGDAAAIEGGILAFRESLLDPRRTDVRARANALRPLLTAKLESLAAGSQRILIAPDAELNLVPFQALTDSSGGFLVSRYLFTYLTSGRDLVARPARRDAAAPLIVSNPAFGPVSSDGRLSPIGRRFEPLPGAALEARSVAAILSGARLLDGAEATEASVKQAAAPLILHFATHGFFLAPSAANPTVGTRGVRLVGTSAAASIPPLLRSGLALAGANLETREGAEDGILTASEAALLDLRGTELVVLSACESGLGVINAGESVYGLRRAFMIAGARSIVATLWQVSDRETTTFIVDFYRGLAKGGERSEALREAQRRALADPARRHPFYWAAFVFAGAEGVIRLER